MKADRFESAIIPIRNPSPIRRKIVEDLVTKLMKTEIPAVGLKRVKVPFVLCCRRGQYTTLRIFIISVPVFLPS